MSRSARTKREDVDDGLRAANDAYVDDPLLGDPLTVRRDAYKGDPLAPAGMAAQSFPLRRCPGCQSKNASVVGFKPPRRPVWGCPVCRRRFVADGPE